ncbi:8029_t:CDS:2 [Acaulospora morrowiae]|uniref:8029_t:CDS:1 n=1 Tax=Acaulospora morrowiae TaxID=94023 RepID=A0A9N9G8X3_9GLOM|nr:8029_t:CDS:2 [Acaulospora morrowiae]
MENLPSSSQKRSLPEDSILSSPEASLPLQDHQTKRLRRTLPPISATLSQPASTPFSNSFQLPIPPTLLDPNPSSLSLPPISATDSPVMPIPSPRSLAGQHQELPPIDTLGPLPPIPHLTSTYNSMSISSILSNSDHDPFIRKLDMNIKEMDVGNSTNIMNRSQNQLDFQNHTSSILSVDISADESARKIDVVNRVRGEADGFDEDADGRDNKLSLNRSLFESLNLQRETHLIVKNDDTLNMEGREERHLGHLIYNPKEILPPLEFHENGLLEIWIPSKHLTWENMKVRNRFLWGTDVYTDDSDIVAVLIHTGLYNPLPPPPKSKWSLNHPDHDLCVTIRVLPKLVQYTATTRNKYQSRSWGNHHGVSYKIEKVCEMKNGEAIGRSIGKGRKERLRKFHQMRKRAFEETEYSQNDDSILVFNNEGDPCYKYNPLMMTNDEQIKERLRMEVMYLENDDERYEISYDEASDKYRFAIVLSTTHLGLSAALKDQVTTSVSLPSFPLTESHLEVFRDDLDFNEMAWNIVGVIVADKTNPLHSLLCISKRVFWRRRTLP